MMNPLLINSFTLYLRWIILKLRMSFIPVGSRPWIDYMVHVKNSNLGKKVALYKHTRVVNSMIGDYSYVAKESHIFHANIGKFCSIGPQVWIGLGKHPVSRLVSTHPIFYAARKQIPMQWVEENLFEEFGTIEIGHDVWIGARSIVRDDVKIGNGAIVGAASVVTKDVPPYAVVAGVPAKIIRYRFSPEQINFLQQFQWWNKDIQWIHENRSLMLDIEKFMEKYASSLF